jgi:phage anti-repressor protein
METITINKIEYYNGIDIINNAPKFSKGSRNAHELIRNKNILSDNYIYARLSGKKWNKYDGEVKNKRLDKIFFKKEYIDGVKKLKKELIEEVLDSDDSDESEDDKKNKIKKAPEILYLNDEEKFQDDTGNILEIETRGERKCNNIFFKVHDVAKCFDMKNLYDTIVDNRNKKSYLIDVDYKYFNCISVDTNRKKTIKKDLFLTYEGFLRVLFVSRNNKTSKFIQYAVETLFTVQMGTKEQKDKLVGDMKGVSAETVAHVFDKDACETGGLYGIVLGSVKDLRKSMKIDKMYKDADLVYKFGQTNSMSRRIKEHTKTYGKLEGCSLMVKHFVIIDPINKSSAETELKEYFKTMDNFLTYDKAKEIVILTKTELESVRNVYTGIGKKFAGHITELNTTIKTIETEKTQLEKDIVMIKELCKKDIELSKKEYEKLEKDNKYIIKENECNMMKLQNEIDLLNRKIKTKK